MATVTKSKEKGLEAFAKRVMEVARGVNGIGRFSEHKVFIHAVWALGDFEPTLVEFKQLLIAAHRDRLLTLCRLDLVEAADPYDVRRSRTSYMDSEFNLILTD